MHSAAAAVANRMASAWPRPSSSATTNAAVKQSPGGEGRKGTCDRKIWRAIAPTAQPAGQSRPAPTHAVAAAAAAAPAAAAASCSNAPHLPRWCRQPSPLSGLAAAPLGRRSLQQPRGGSREGGREVWRKEVGARQQCDAVAVPIPRLPTSHPPSVHPPTSRLPRAPSFTKTVPTPCACSACAAAAICSSVSVGMPARTQGGGGGGVRSSEDADMAQHAARHVAGMSAAGAT